MEYELCVPTADGQRRTEAQVVYEVLSRKTSQPTFLQNVGVTHHSSRSRMSKLAAELEKEKLASAELSNVAKIQRDQINQLTTKAKERLEKQAAMSAKIERFLMLK